MKILLPLLIITTLVFGSLSANADRLFDFLNSYLQKNENEILISLPYLERAGLSKGPFKKEDFLKYIIAGLSLAYKGSAAQQDRPLINKAIDYYLDEIGSKEDLNGLLDSFVESIGTQFASLKQHYLQNAVAGNLQASEREAAAEKAILLGKESVSVIEKLKSVLESSLGFYEFRKKIKLLTQGNGDKATFSF